MVQGQKHKQRQMLAAKPKSQILQEQEAAPPAATAGRQPVVSRGLSDLPAGPAARGLWQSALLQMQRARGNAFVQRQMPEGGVEQATAPAPARETQSETAADGGAAPTELSAGGSSVSVDGGGVNISGGMVNVSAGMTQVSGVLSADTLVANSVVSSSYSPGAGNIW